MGMLARVHASRGVDDHGVPGLCRAMLVQIEKDFGEQTGIEIGVRLKLDLNEKQWPVELVFRRGKNTIETESGSGSI